MFRRLLIANRGEIAIRVARTARELGIHSIGVYSEADRAAAAEMGYPGLFKATAGGGGIGMSRVDRPADLATAFESASSVALANFGNPDLFMEKYLRRARHVEVQVLLDARDGVGFVERECSVQRRHQKLVEETPSPAGGPRLRTRPIVTAAHGVRWLGYRDARTAEV